MLKNQLLYQISTLRKNKAGESGVQFLFFISIFIFLGVIVFRFLMNAQKSTRDSERITTLQNIQKAIDLYHDSTGAWPKGDNDGFGWDEGMHSAQDTRFIQPLIDKNFLLVPPKDPLFYGSKAYKYAVFPAGYAGCDINKGEFYVLGITDLESDSRPPQNFLGSGFHCPKKNWQDDFDYVVGKFEAD